jgi:hypothetical protein
MYAAALNTGADGGVDILKLRMELNPVVRDLVQQITALGGKATVPGFRTPEGSVFHTEVVYTLERARGCIDLWLARSDQPGADLLVIVRVTEVN